MKDNLCIVDAPYNERDLRCFLVPYTLWDLKSYKGYAISRSSIILSLMTFAIIDAEAIDNYNESPWTKCF